MVSLALRICFFFFKQKTAYDMRISDWSSDVCSSDLIRLAPGEIFDRIRELVDGAHADVRHWRVQHHFPGACDRAARHAAQIKISRHGLGVIQQPLGREDAAREARLVQIGRRAALRLIEDRIADQVRSEEHTSELQSLMRNSYAVFCL